MTLRNGVAWLSSSSAEIARARAVLDALRKPGVIDELGFLMLNGAFAERLNPGVTTIMTRARYLIFIPAIYRYLEESRKAVGRDADRIVRDLQFDLRNALAKNEAHYIGKEGGRALVRTPAAVYWSSLGSLGIATQRLSEASYQRRLSGGYFASGVFKDDEAAHDEEPDSLWTEDLKVTHVMPGGVFPDSTSFQLRRAEATFLSSRYAGLEPDGNETLVTRMVSLGLKHGAKSLEEIEHPWEIPGCSPQVMDVLEHARRLSMLGWGATLQYYRMLIDKRQDADPGVENAFSDWWEKAKPVLATWDLESFFALMARWGAGRGRKDRDFMTSWIERCVSARTGQTMLADSTARQIIGRREDHVRPGKQRLRVKHQLGSWRLPDGVSGDSYLLGYRHRVARQIAIDIVKGLKRGAA